MKLKIRQQNNASVFTAGRVVLAVDDVCFSRAAESNDNWMPSGSSPYPDMLFALRDAGNTTSERRLGTSSGVGGGAGGGGPLWTKWHRAPYGQYPEVWYVRHSSVLYLGCRCIERSSPTPCANWHRSP